MALPCSWPGTKHQGMNSPADAAGTPETGTLDQRISRLEARVDALIEAVEVLARGLEDGPLTERPGMDAEKAARRTHELLLLARSAPS